MLRLPFVSSVRYASRYNITDLCKRVLPKKAPSKVYEKEIVKENRYMKYVENWNKNIPRANLPPCHPITGKPVVPWFPCPPGCVSTKEFPCNPKTSRCPYRGSQLCKAIIFCGKPRWECTRSRTDVDDD